MGNSDPIYVFKQHFSRNDAEIVVSGLIHHRVIWNRLADEGYLENLLALLPTQKENWSAAHVCLAAIGVLSSGSNSFDPSQITPQALPQKTNQKLTIPLDQIAPVAAGILSEKSSSVSWSKYLEEKGLDQLNASEIQELWGTVFTLVLYLSNERPVFLQEFTQNSNTCMPDLLAFILSANPSWIEAEYQNDDQIIPKVALDDLLQLLKKMSLYESKTIIQRMADGYLLNNPVNEVIAVSSKLNSNNGQDLLRNIDFFRNYACLANYSSHKELADDFSKIALNNSEQLSQMLTALNNAIKMPEKNDADLSAKLSMASANGVAGKALQATQIKDSDLETARKIGKQIYHEITVSRDIGSLFEEGNLGSVVSPVQLVNLLMDLGLINEAAQSADCLIAFQPLNADLLRLAARLNSEYGDYAKSALYYEHLELLADLTREEKINQVEALQNSGKWLPALVVWKRINLVSLDDYQKKAICCYKAGDANCLEETKNYANNFYSSEGLFQVLEALIELDNAHSESAQQLIDAFLQNRKRDRYSIRFLIEYYQKTEQWDEAREVFESLSSLELNTPEIYVKRYELADQAGDRDNCKNILAQAAADSQINNLSAIEKLIAACLEDSDLSCAAEILHNTVGKWILAPHLTAYQAQILNEQGKHWQARELLEPLLQRKDVCESWLVQYGLALLESRQEKFPLESTAISRVILDEQFEANFQKYPENMLLQVIRTELDPDHKLSCYQEILADKNNHLNPEIWRVHAGLGKYYFEKGQFDLAVVNFKEAGKAQPQKKALNVMLLKALGRIGLYDEAMSVFTAMLAQGSLDIADMMEINASLKRSDQWLLNLEKFAQIQPKNTILLIGLAELYAGKKETEKTLTYVRKSGLTDAASAGDRLACVQILLQAGLEKEARRLLEGFLSGKEEIRDGEYLSAAFLYLKMNETRKAANLLNLIEHTNSAVLALKAEFYMKLDQPHEALAAIQLALELVESPAHSLVNLNAIRGIQPPEAWQRFNGKPQDLYAYSIELRIASKDIIGAFEQVMKNLDRFPNDLGLQTLALELAHILGEDAIVQEILENSPDWKAISAIRTNMPIWGETALQFGQEVLAANVLSRCLEVTPQSARVKALQARLLERNGNHDDAAALLDELLTIQQADPQMLFDGNNGNILWLAEATLELKHYSQAMEIVRQAIDLCGFTQTTASLFLKAMVRVVFENWLKHKLDVEIHLDAINDDDLACFEALCNSEDPKIREDKEIGALIADIKFWLGNGESGIGQFQIENMAGTHAYVQLTATYLCEGSQKAQILMDNFQDDPEAWMILAILELKDNPIKSVEYTTALLRSGQADALKYALLAFGKKNLGQNADAYAALNLALADWPEEYKWQLQAGEMSKSLGDVRSSLEHFKKAAEVNKDDDTQIYLGELSLQAGSPVGIAYLEKKLNGTRQDFDVLLQLGELGIKNNKLQKAARYLENARKINPKDARVHLLLSEVAMAVGNLEKAREMISEADQIQPHDAQILLQKAAIIEKGESSQAALDYLQHLQNTEIQQNADVIIRQAEYIRAVKGAEKALEFLLPKSYDSDNSALLLETAKNYLEMGKLDLSEEFAERALQLNPLDSQPMSMLARIFGQSGDLDKAVDLLIKAIQNAPFEAAFYIELARIYQSRRDIVAATETLQKGQRAIPLNFDLPSALGLLYYQQGQYHLAQENLQQAASINPRDENVKRLLSTLTNANIIQGNMQNDTFVEEA